MEFIANFFAPLVSLISQAPVCITWLVGIGLAIARWKSHPKTSALALTSLSAFLILSIFTSILYTTLPSQLGASGIVAVFQVVGVCNSLIHAVLWGLLLAAIFGWRRDE